MNSAISAPLLIYTLASVVVLGLAHVLISRHSARGRHSASPQTSLARLILFLNAPVLTGVGVIAWNEERTLLEAGSMLIFCGVVYNGMAYAYFHVFNMSETARRIRILLHVLVYDSVNADNLRSDYSPADMVVVRLGRLEQMNQIVRGTDGCFRIGGWLLLSAARVIRVWRQLLRFEPRSAA